MRSLATLLLLTALAAPAFAATQGEFDITTLPLLSAPSLSFDREPAEPAWQATGSRPSGTGETIVTSQVWANNSPSGVSAGSRIRQQLQVHGYRYDGVGWGSC